MQCSIEALVLIIHWTDLIMSLNLLQVIELNRIMGCVNGKPVLSDADLDFIATHTAVSREQVDRQYENFLARHPDGKITKRDFRNMMEVGI